MTQRWPRLARASRWCCWCPCRAARTVKWCAGTYLLPARKSSNLHAWQLNITDATTPLAAFAGEATTAKAQVKSWNAGFTPTVLFLGPQGQELAERLAGAGIPDFYGAYLEQRLDTARKALVSLR
jgi:hypothetical protein